MASAWQPRIKRYRHFDGLVGVSTLSAVAISPAAVAKHPFYPLISYEKRWTKFRRAGQPSELKSRIIRYASRKDAAIFSYYRSLLAERYEDILKYHGLDDSVLAYRKVRKSSGSGKSNIDFAHDAFGFIRKTGNCSYLALDISGFFDNLEHGKVKDDWKRLLNVSSLPDGRSGLTRNVPTMRLLPSDLVYNLSSEITTREQCGAWMPQLIKLFE